MKYFLYDFGNMNHEFFLFINKYINSPDHFLVKLASYLGSYLNFPIMLLFFILFLRGSKRFKDLEFYKLFTKFSIFFTTVIFTMIIVGAFKAAFAYTRPFCTGSIEVFFSKDLANSVLCHQSFPSGHTAYSLALVLGSWSILSWFFRIFGAFSVIIIMFSRVISGMHFPADVIWGVIIATIMYFLAKIFTEELLKHFEEDVKNSFLAKILGYRSKNNKKN